MTCKHNWNFLDGLTKRIRCTRCSDVKFADKQDTWASSLAHGYTLAKASTAPKLAARGK